VVAYIGALEMAYLTVCGKAALNPQGTRKQGKKRGKSKKDTKIDGTKLPSLFRTKDLPF
jgi:hypothetical protein